MNVENTHITAPQVSPTDTLRTVIAAIDGSPAQAAFVVNQEGRLIGVITDGDVRRGLLRGESLLSPADHVMRRDFKAGAQGLTSSEALKLMLKEHLRQLPVLDEKGKIVQLYILDHLVGSKTRTNRVVLMAGGKGERLRPLTEHCPKPMLLVNGKPMLEIILEQCIDAGFREFYISVNYLKHVILDYFGNGEKWGVTIKYLAEDHTLGTAGALSLLPPLNDLPVLVINGDVLTKVDFKQLLWSHEEKFSAATICVRQHITKIPYGVVTTKDSKIVALEEKPQLTHFVNAGIYVLNSEVLNLLEADQQCDMPVLIEKAIKCQYAINAFPVHEYWKDIGHIDALTLAQSDWV
jgi:dTDP-glucose pyrophosphorylase